MLTSLKKIIKLILPKKYRQHPSFMYFRSWVVFKLKLRKQLTKQLSHKNKKTHENKKTCEPNDSGMRVLVPAIETSHYHFFQILILSKALKIRGAAVKILVCDEYLDACEIKSVRNQKSSDPCWSCRFNLQHIVGIFGLEVIRLQDYITDAERSKFQHEAEFLATRRDCKLTRHGIDLSQSINDSIIRYFFGAVPDDGELLHRVRASHTMTALLCAEVAYRIDKMWKPSVVFYNNFSYSAWRPFYLYYKSNGNRFNSVCSTAFNYHGQLIDQTELYGSSERFTKYKQSRKNSYLNEDEANELNSFLKIRQTGEDQYFKDYAYYDVNASQEMLKKLNLRPTKRNIFLFSNVYWDIGASDLGKLYDNVLDWVLDTIELVKDHEDCHLYIKPHPAEVLDSVSSLKGVTQVIDAHYPKLPSNITVIRPEWKLNTYELFPYIDLGVMFNGTLGLEMMLADIPVVSTGLTQYEGLGFSMQPNNVEQYQAILLQQQKPPAVNKKHLELFAYFYFIKTIIPWHLTKRAYADIFDGFTIESLDDLVLGKNPHLDHLCNCILDPRNTIPESW